MKAIRQLLTVVLLTGCASYRSTPADKRESLAQYETPAASQEVTTQSGHTVRLKPNGRLAMVTAWVFAGDAPAVERAASRMTRDMPEPPPTPAGPELKQVTSGGMGGAVAITPDGYFLTAAHVVAYRSCWVAYASTVHPVTYRFVKARVVFSNPAADLAVIKVAMATPRWLELPDAPADPTGAVVFSGHLGTDPAAGEILATEQRHFGFEGKHVPYHRLKIQIPIMPGDSGGPVVDQHGRLRGILTDEIYGLGWKLPHRAYASMPRPSFIASLIEKDRAQSRQSSLSDR
jgi:S1-C subfamily serine protease